MVHKICRGFFADMKCGEHKSPEITDRTLEDLNLDHKRYIINGGLKKNAKYFNNVITEPISKIL